MDTYSLVEKYGVFDLFLNMCENDCTTLDVICSLYHCLQIEYGETDAWLSMELMFHLSVLPLTRQLTNISGNLWHKTLQVKFCSELERCII